MGHTKSQCDKVKAFRSKAKSTKPQAHHLEDADSGSLDEGADYSPLSHLESMVNKLATSKPYRVVLEINDHSINIELDTGSPWTIVSSQMFSQVGKMSKICPCKAGLKTYTGTEVPVVGEAIVSVKYSAQKPPKSS